MKCETPDEVLRQWALDTSVAAHRKGTRADTILRDAKKYYGFLLPQNGSVVSIPTYKEECPTKP